MKMKIFTKFISLFTKYYTIYWGIQPYLITKDKSTLREEKTFTFKLTQGVDILFYSYPTSFGKLAHIWRIPPEGSKMPVKDVIDEWNYMTLKDYTIYSYKIKIDEESILIETFSFIK